MADPTGFLRVPREERRRTPAQRLRDWRAVHQALPEGWLRRQIELQIIDRAWREGWITPATQRVARQCRDHQ